MVVRVAWIIVAVDAIEGLTVVVFALWVVASIHNFLSPVAAAKGLIFGDGKVPLVICLP